VYNAYRAVGKVYMVCVAALLKDLEDLAGGWKLPSQQFALPADAEGGREGAGEGVAGSAVVAGAKEDDEDVSAPHQIMF